RSASRRRCATRGLSTTGSHAAIASTARGVRINAGLGHQIFAFFFRNIGTEAQGPVGNFQLVFGTVDGDGDVSSHSRQQLQVRILKLNDRDVGHHVLHRGGIHADFFYSSGKFITRERVDLEGSARAYFHVADIAFVGLGVN